jgi:hypothetical protein
MLVMPTRETLKYWKIWIFKGKILIPAVCMKQNGEYRLSAVNDSGEAIKNSEYLFEFEAKFESIQMSS